MSNEQLERQVIELIATDRISIPIKSMAGKLDKKRPKLARTIVLTEYCGEFVGDRVYASISYEDRMKTRGMRDGVEEFTQRYPRYGAILNGLIEEERALRETHLDFGVNPGCKLTSEDYMNVMRNLGFSEQTSERLYPELMKISNSLSRKRNEERSILVG
jgi:hypothetical protein